MWSGVQGSMPIDEFIAELEKDPVWHQDLIEARKELAQDLCHLPGYAPGSPTYERLMRGEGPSKPSQPDLEVLKGE